MDVPDDAEITPSRVGLAGDRRWWWFGVVAPVLAAWNLAVAQPLLDLLGANPAFFVARDATNADIYLLAVGITLLVPLVVAGFLVLVGSIHRRAGLVASAVVAGVLFGLLGLRIAKLLLDAPAGVAVGLGLGLGLGLVILLWRSASVRSFVAVLAVAPLVFLVLFLLVSPVSKILFAADVAAASGRVIGDPAPVVMVVFDELSMATLLDESGHIDAASFPGFARLADTSTWYRNTLTTHQQTPKAVPAILDGRVPVDGKPPIASEHPDSLFTLLGGAYDIRAVEPVTRLCPESLCETTEETRALPERTRSLLSDLWVVYRHQVLPEELTGGLPPIDHTWGGFGGGTTPTTPTTPTSSSDAPSATSTSGPQPFEHARIVASLDEDRAAIWDEFVAGIEPGSDPTFDFLHVLLPHAPWRYLPDGSTYQQSHLWFGIDDETWDDDEWTSRASYQRYLLQLQMVDARLGALLDHLERVGMLDDTLLVVTADHGVSFVPGESRRTLTPETLGGVGYVPLFVKAPGQTDGVVDGSPRQTLDVFPTVADLLDVEPVEPVDGISALDPHERVDRVVRDLDGNDVSYGTDATALFETARTKAEVFGPPDPGPFRFYGVGPHRDLVGRAVVDVDPVADSAYRVEYDEAQWWRAVDLDSGFVPAFSVGRVYRDGAAPREPVDLAIAVDGTVAGVTRSFRHVDGGIWWSTMLAPATMSDGANRVEAYVIDAGPDGVRLRGPVGAAGAP